MVISGRVSSGPRWPRMCESTSALASHVNGTSPAINSLLATYSPLPIPDRPWQTVTMDFIGPLSKTLRGFDSVTVFVDKLSKQTHFVASHTFDTWSQEFFSTTSSASMVSHHHCRQGLLDGAESPPGCPPCNVNSVSPPDRRSDRARQPHPHHHAPLLCRPATIQLGSSPSCGRVFCQQRCQHLLRRHTIFLQHRQPSLRPCCVRAQHV